MSDFIQQLGQLSDNLSMSEVRNLAFKQLKKVGWPERKTEAYRYTRLAHLADIDIWQEQVELSSTSLKPIEELESIKVLATTDGFSWPSQLPEGLTIQLQTEGLSCINSQASLATAQINSLLANYTLLISVANNAGKLPVVEVQWPDIISGVHHQQIEVKVGLNSKLVLLERHEAKQGLSTAQIQCDVADNAQLEHYRLMMTSESFQHFGHVNYDLGRDSQINCFHLGLGGRLIRNQLNAAHQESGSHVQLNGLFLPKENDTVDFHTCVDHEAPHCETDEVFRGLAADEGKGVFNGRIHILPDAQKSRAEMSNKNLLLSPKAQINTKPELEIYADDVRCAHGATIAQLDEEAEFYLTSRGISKAEAKVLLSFAFINELLDQLPLKPLAAWLRPQLAERFASDKKLIRHIA